MTDADLDLRLRRWLDASAAAGAPATLRRRVLDIPAAPSSSRGFLHRFLSIPLATGLVASMAMVAIVLSGQFFTLFDRAPGADGGPCNNRQLLRGLESLRDADGYRYVETQQVQVLLTGPDVSLANPVFGWEDRTRSEVAHLAPDRTRDVVVPLLPGADRGWIEQVRIGDDQWQLRVIDGEERWVGVEEWPFTNWAYAYIQNAIGIIDLPGIASVRFGSEPVPDGLPGAGGCTIASRGEADRVVSLRIDGGRITHFAIGPAADAPESRDASRSLFTIDYTVPAADEFVAPADWINENVLYPEVVETSATPVATLPPATSGWAPIELPLSGTDSTSVSGVVEVEGGYAAVGSGQDPEMVLHGVAWWSADGVAWESVTAPADWTGMAFSELIFDGETLLAVAYRTQEAAADGTRPADRPETWLSSDGLTWERGGMFEAGANPNTPVPVEDGWVTAGSIWTGMVQRPAFFTSPDGVRWTTVQPEGVAYGAVSTPVVQPDGSLVAISCETPEETNTAAGSGCFVRDWTSDDGGATWTAGAVREEDPEAVSEITPAGDIFLGIQNDADTVEATVVRSDDGDAWEAMDPPSDDIYIHRLEALSDGVLLIGQRRDTASIISSLWRTTDGGETWEELPLAGLPGAVGLSADHVLDQPDGIAIVGVVYLDETTARPVIWTEP